ncbi:MAG: hypothetical protein COV46_07350 [Deltaproteobacteria bacterium CG11_big_fil_rev_8_21_14_0_20_49_13]|nr:MAG: hypothetical protein COV46_07350 [Deltaproteobacteria bacterium CG11_big_fil_rev_8_21_14_0_20_49_13]
MLRELIEVMGICTYSLLCLTALLGLLKWKFAVSWIKPKYHFTLAVLTLTSASTHLTLILTHKALAK